MHRLDDFLKYVLADFAVACVVGTYLILIVTLFMEQPLVTEAGLVILGWSLSFFGTIVAEHELRA